MPTTIRRSLPLVVRAVRSTVLAGFAFATEVPFAGAQLPARRDQADMIPRDLVLALVSYGAGVGGANLRVGQAPDDIPPELVPPATEVLGSMTQFENVIIVLGMRESPDSAIGTMEERLVSAGWTRPPAPPARAVPRGFVSSDFPVGPMGGAPSMICKGDEFVNLSSMYRSSGGTLLKVAFNRGGRYSPCRQRREDGSFRSPYEEAPIPTLRAPTAAMTTEGGGMSSSSGNQVTVSTRLSTQLKTAEVIAHYDSQMKAAGWAAIGDGALDFLAARTYQKKDEKDRTWWAVLYSIKSPDARIQDVALQLTRR